MAQSSCARALARRNFRATFPSFVKKFPPKHFYHLAEPANVASIQRHGLLSAEQLIKRAGLRGAELNAALGHHRATNMVLPDGTIIRDQMPMPPGALTPALAKGLTPSDWYRFLNKYIFLWATEDRMERHQVVFRKYPQTLFVFDAARLIADRRDELFLSPINSGNARRRPATRSYETFVPYAQWLKQGWPSVNGQVRSQTTTPAEVAIKRSLPLEPYLIEIRRP